jgi:hypothetical protein
MVGKQKNWLIYNDRVKMAVVKAASVCHTEKTELTYPASKVLKRKKSENIKISFA